MEDLKYILSEQPHTFSDGLLLYRIMAVKDFSNVTAGDYGGYVAGGYNLSQFGDCWVYDDAKVYDSAHVSGNARISGKAQIFGNSRVTDFAIVTGLALVYGSAIIAGNAQIYGTAQIGGKQFYDNGTIFKGRIKSHVK